MAEHLASLFGTEKDRVNCPFYFKIGACRHGDRCSRAHNKPSISPTVLLHNLWRSPAAEAAAQAAAVAAETGLPPPPPKPLTHDEERRAQEDFEDFFEDVFEELAQHGELEALHVCDNVADHLAGSVYAQFADEDDAAAAMEALRRRFYDGRPIVAEFSPVTDFREATCRQYEERNCARGGYCNFMHLRPVSRSLRRELFGRWADNDRDRRRGDRDRGGHRDRYDDDRRERERERGGRGDRDRRDDRSRRDRYYHDDDDRGDDRRDRFDDSSRRDRERRSGGGGGRRSHSRSRSRSRERGGRGRERERGGSGGGGGGGRETSEERRARIAAWNAELETKE